MDAVTAWVLVTGLLVALAAALVGSFLVVRGQAMLTDAVSHGVVLGVAVTFLATGAVSGPLQLLGAAAAGVLTAVLTQALSDTGRVRRDAATGLVFPALFSLGVLLLGTLARDAHVDVHTVLLGEIGLVWLDQVDVLGASVPRATLQLAIVLLADALFLLAFWDRLVGASFDAVHAEVGGLNPRGVVTGLVVLTSITAVAALDAVGVVLFVAFAVVPAVTATLHARSMATVIASACAIGAVSVIGGAWLSTAFDVSIGGTMALLTGAPLVLAVLASRRRGLWHLS